jgi:hypothetical protein
MNAFTVDLKRMLNVTRGAKTQVLVIRWLRLYKICYVILKDTFLNPRCKSTVNVWFSRPGIRAK